MTGHNHRIRKLDPVISSQIAAGEVVERPASVVKELVENSIDAGARRIIVEIEGGGLSLIRVSDDGSGMSKEDALMSLERFATSKLSGIDDLQRIKTLGFRGEALPSIAACSRLTLETMAQGGLAGVRIRVEGGKVAEVSEVGLPPGTTVTVEDLFYNTPARLKFMKSEAREREAIIEVVERLALAWPCISFILKSGPRIVFSTNGKGLRSALADVFGPEALEAMVPMEVAEDEAGNAGKLEPGRELGGGTGRSSGLKLYKVSGFLGLPNLYRRQKDRQIFSVNSRPVRNQLLGWALDSAFLGLIPPKTYPVAVLNVEVPLDEVDVNVHPTKAEVKFRDERKVKHLITEGARRALSKAGFSSLQDTGEKRDPNLEVWRPGPRAEVKETPAIFDFGVAPGNNKNLFSKQVLVEDSASVGEPRDVSRLEDQTRTTGSGWEREEPSLPPGWEYLGALRDTYLLVKTESSLLVIDKHALAESLAYHALCQRKSGSQELLVPEMVRLEPREADLYEECEEALEATGFGSRCVGSRTILVNRVPVILGKPLPPGALKDVLQELSKDRERNVSPERILASVQISLAACHSSVRAREPLTREEALTLINAYYRFPNAGTCPHGRPTVKEIPIRELDSFFGR
ncbi:MAG TPA: DNA mismatch repair endonuclease MutL [Firmicutes bacterium]|nr:DNA mismatch repair endonuclease MutL [Candidatus Fermentithermobacillaceae bacterium]